MNRYVEVGLLAVAAACVGIIVLAYVALGIIEIAGGDWGMGIAHSGGIVVAIGVVAAFVFRLGRAVKRGHP